MLLPDELMSSSALLAQMNGVCAATEGSVVAVEMIDTDHLREVRELVQEHVVAAPQAQTFPREALEVGAVAGTAGLQAVVQLETIFSARVPVQLPSVTLQVDRRVPGYPEYDQDA